MATVITNLLSAIPIFGQDLVELIWNPLEYNKNNLFFEIYTQYLKIKTTLIISSFNTYDACSINSWILPTIGNINWTKVRKEINFSEEDKLKLKDIPFEYLGRLAGIIDGDGYISIVASDALRKYATIKLTIMLTHSDLQMLEEIVKTLGIGRINGPYKNLKGLDIVSLTFNKTELQQVLFPLFIIHRIFFLTLERRKQYEKAIYLMVNNLIKMSDIPESLTLLKETDSKYIEDIPINKEDYLILPFFKSWLVGFTISEGSFLIKNNLDASFQLKQRTYAGDNLFSAIQLKFNSTRKITIENEKYAQFAVSSKKDIQTVLDFFSSPDNPTLLGNKLIQYNNWINYLKDSKRYGKLKFYS